VSRLYTEQFLKSNHPHAKEGKRQPVTAMEIKKFTGLTLKTGIVRKPITEIY
jgi:hypothetical protein